MIKLIMKMTKGPTKSDKPIEFTDWDRVKDFAIKISQN
jgi:menaquinone-dependent protoporphyrinogen oxidase